MASLSRFRPDTLSPYRLLDLAKVFVFCPLLIIRRRLNPSPVGDESVTKSGDFYVNKEKEKHVRTAPCHIWVEVIERRTA